MSESKRIEAIKVEANRLEEDCVYSAKGHFNSSSLWWLIHYILGVGAAVFAGVSILAPMPDFLSGLFTPQVSAMFAGLLAAILTFVNPGQFIDRHKNSGEKLGALRSRFRRLREIDCIEGNCSGLRAELEALCKQKSCADANAPKILWIAFQLARFGVWTGESLHVVDKKKT